MNFKLILIASALLLCFSCEDEVIENEVSLEDAEAAQFISFEIGDRAFHLTEFKDDDWPFGNSVTAIVKTDNINFDPATSTPISRAVYAFIPDDQVAPDHIETFGIEFNRVFLNTDIDADTNQVLDDEQFRSEFLTVGEQDDNLSNFGFHQTYLHAYGEVGNQSIRIKEIQTVAGNPSLILVSGGFDGRLVDWEGTSVVNYLGGDMSNGEFTLLIEN